MFEINRVYSDRNPASGAMQWFYQTREGVQGPFDTQMMADESLQKHLEYCRQQSIDGGRTLGVEDAKFTLTTKS